MDKLHKSTVSKGVELIVFWNDTAGHIILDVVTGIAYYLCSPRKMVQKIQYMYIMVWKLGQEYCDTEVFR